MAENAFRKHFNDNDIYDFLLEKGYITEADVDAAGNNGDGYSYEQQDAANERILAGIKRFQKNNPDDPEIEAFVASYPQVQKFEPKAEDWQKYSNKQMGRLAESMKFNWRNKEDRSQMMKQLMDEQILKDKKKIYQDYKKENPVAAFINENIIAPNVSNRISKGEDIANRDIALDAANVGTYLFPGAGAAASKVGKAAMFATDAALQGGVGAASDINQGNELGVHNVTAPIIGAGVGTVTDLVPRLAKMTIDVATGGFGGNISKPVGDAAESWITKIFGDEVEAAKKALAKEAKEAAKIETVRKNASKESLKEVMKRGRDIAPNAQVKRDAHFKDIYAQDPERLRDRIERGTVSRADYDRWMSDPRFRIAYTADEYTGIKKHGRAAARATSRQAGKGIMITLTNRDRQKNSKPTIEQVFASPELADWVRLKKRGYNPAIPQQFKEYESALDAMIHDPNRNLR